MQQIGNLGKYFSQYCIEVLCKIILENFKVKCKYLFLEGTFASDFASLAMLR